MHSSKFRLSMITLALQAAEAMRDSPLASKLKTIGFHPASMQKEAEVLSDLHTQSIAARNAAIQATAILSERAVELAAKYASYCNFVRGLTNDPGLRRTHGVKSPGVRKGPRFRRGSRAKDGATGAEAPSTSTSSSPSTAFAPSSNDASSSSGANGVATP
jgi:hypothetical protein